MSTNVYDVLDRAVDLLEELDSVAKFPTETVQLTGSGIMWPKFVEKCTLCNQLLVNNSVHDHDQSCIVRRLQEFLDDH